MCVWQFTRLAFVLIAAGAAFFLDLSPQPSSPTDLRDMAFVFIGGVIFVLSYATWLQMTVPIYTNTWLRPSWKFNPFNYKQPLQFFHLLAYSCCAFGLVFLARVAALHAPFSSYNSAFFLLGGGMLLGLQIFSRLFLRKNPA